MMAADDAGYIRASSSSIATRGSTCCVHIIVGVSFADKEEERPLLRHAGIWTTMPASCRMHCSTCPPILMHRIHRSSSRNQAAATRVSSKAPQSVLEFVGISSNDNDNNKTARLNSSVSSEDIASLERK